MADVAGGGPTTGPAPTDLLLQAVGLRKAFGGVVALADGNLAVRRGEIHGLLGQNGAGKSTLIKGLAGTPAPDQGQIMVAGSTLPPGHGAAQASSAGLAFIHQEGALIEELTVEENIALTVGFPRRAGLIDWRSLRRIARDALDLLGVDLDPGRMVADLPLASRTVVAIARALAQSAQVIVLDEPTASVSPEDARALFTILRRLCAAGRGIVFVSHRLDEVFEICDRVTVLRDGRTVASGVDVLTLDQSALVEFICGHAVRFGDKQATIVQGAPSLRIADLKGPLVAPLSLSIWPGEIVGLTGLSDAGTTEVGEMLFGVTPPDSGEVALQDRPYAPRSPAEAMRLGVGYIPPDRNRLGLARDMTLAENLFFNPRRGAANLTAGGFLLPLVERRAADGLLTRFDVRPNDPEARIVNLSGGNAQKVLVARWLQEAASLMIVNDPTVGVDVGAREDIYALIRQAAASGSAVLLISSDFEEVQTLCHRALVLVRGVVVAELIGNEVSSVGITGALAQRSKARPNGGRVPQASEGETHAI